MTMNATCLYRYFLTWKYLIARFFCRFKSRKMWKSIVVRLLPPVGNSMEKLKKRENIFLLSRQWKKKSENDSFLLQIILLFLSFLRNDYSKQTIQIKWIKLLDLPENVYHIYNLTPTNVWIPFFLSCHCFNKKRPSLYAQFSFEENTNWHYILYHISTRNNSNL